jgi:hypothetical protein
VGAGTSIVALSDSSVSSGSSTATVSPGETRISMIWDVLEVADVRDFDRDGARGRAHTRVGIGASASIS